MKKRITALVLAVALVFAMTAFPATAADPRVWDGSVASGFASGSGTRDNPYIISTAGELALFRDMVNSGNASICGKMVNDIDIIYYGELELSTTTLTLPHPRAHEREFVLRPLSDLDAMLVLPGQQLSVAQLLENLPAERPTVQAFDL